MNPGTSSSSWFAQLHESEHAWRLLSWQGALRYLAIARDGVTKGGMLQSLRDLQVMLLNAPHWDLYAQLNPWDLSFRGIKTSRHHITHWRYLLHDVDDHALHMGDGNCTVLTPETIATGRGHHHWLRVPLLPLNDDLRVTIERGTRTYLQGHPHSDKSCTDLCRVVRIPGSFNQRAGVMCRFLEEPHDLPRRDLDRILCAPPPAPSSRTLCNRSLASTLPHLNETASRFLCQGWATPGRHKATYATAASLRDVGIPQDLATAWIHAARCRPPLPPRDLDRAITNAYRGVVPGASNPPAGSLDPFPTTPLSCAQDAKRAETL